MSKTLTASGIVTPARETYRKATAPAWKTYAKAPAEAWKTYAKAPAEAWKTYAKATAPAREAYKNARAEAFFWRMQQNHPNRRRDNETRNLSGTALGQGTDLLKSLLDMTLLR